MKYVLVYFLSVFWGSLHNSDGIKNQPDCRKPCICEESKPLIQAEFVASNLDNLNVPRKPYNKLYSARASEITPEEREEKINRGMARIMQLLTFMGHVDNFLTDKATGLLKILGMAPGPNEMENFNDESYKPRRIYSPKFTATINT